MASPDTKGESARDRLTKAQQGVFKKAGVPAKASETDRAQCVAAGCSDYVVKPADTRQLLAIIVRNLPPR